LIRFAKVLSILFGRKRVKFFVGLVAISIAALILEKSSKQQNICNQQNIEWFASNKNHRCGYSRRSSDQH
jgi:hypothetical protein